MNLNMSFAYGFVIGGTFVAIMFIIALRRLK